MAEEIWEQRGSGREVVRFQIRDTLSHEEPVVDDEVAAVGGKAG